MKKHKTLLLRLATNLSSREAGFCFALLGVLVQACHTWFLAYELSSLPGIWRTLQAGMMAIFISAALLYFTLKSSDEETKTAKKYRKIVMWFACVETFINLYYWGDHLLIKMWPTPDYGSFIIAIPFSILLPFVLKSYGSEVRTEDYSDLDDVDDIIESKNVDVDELNVMLDSLIKEREKENVKEPDTINDSYDNDFVNDVYDEHVYDERKVIESDNNESNKPFEDKTENHSVSDSDIDTKEAVVNNIDETEIENELLPIEDDSNKDAIDASIPLSNVYDSDGNKISEEPISVIPSFNKK